MTLTPDVKVTEKARLSVLPVLRKLGGQATVGDVVEGTGLPAPEAAATLWTLVQELRGHVDVNNRGDVLFRFPPDLKKPTESEAWEAFKQSLYRMLKQGFKVGVMLMLVVYFVVFLVIAIAALVAMLARGSDSDSWDGEGMSSGLGDLFGMFFWVNAPTPDYQPYQRWDRHRGMSTHKQGRQTAKRPLYEQIMAFVFGEEMPRPDPTEAARNLVAYARENHGVLTATEAAMLLGVSIEEASKVLSKVTFDNNGFVELTDDALLLYRIESLVTQARGRSARTPWELTPAQLAAGSAWSWAWEREEPEVRFNNNSDGMNILFAVLNLFNLLWSGFFAFGGGIATLLSAIFGPAVIVVGGLSFLLGWLPFTFSFLFFAIPAIRLVRMTGENERRKERNIWRRMYRRLFQTYVRDARVSQVDAATVADEADLKPYRRPFWRKWLDKLGDALQGVKVGDEAWRFDRLRNEYKAAEAAREGADHSRMKFGASVFSTETALNVNPHLPKTAPDFTPPEEARRRLTEPL